MKVLVAITFWVCIVLNGVHGDETRNLMLHSDTNKIIGRIRAQYEIINANQPSYRSSIKNTIDEDESTEGGSVFAYRDHQKIRKLILIHYGETGKLRIEYYFNQTGLCFAFERAYRYSMPFYETGWKIAAVKESRYYFYNRQMIRWLQGNVTQKPNTAAYKYEARTLLNDSKKYSDYMSK